MKKRTLIAVSAIVAILTSGLALAEKIHGGHKGGHRGHGINLMHMIDKMEKKLGLSEEQVIQLEEIAIDSKSQMKNVRQQRFDIRQQLITLDPTSAEYEASVSALSDEIAALTKQRTLAMAAVYKEASAVLTEPQRTELQQMIQKRMEKRARRRAARAS